MSRSAPITLGDLALTVSYEVSGRHLLETAIDPEEWPQVELRRLATADGTDVSGLLEFSPVYEHVLEAVTRYEDEDREEARAEFARFCDEPA